MDENAYDFDANFADARRKLAELNERARQNTQRASALAEDANSIVATARSARGEVTVRAHVGGRLADLSFGDAADELSLDALGRLTLETITRAQREAMTLLAERGAELFGPESDIARGMASDAERSYPDTTPGR
ncbi:YbaB/EbfC family nucleoid-associated protein [Microbacterium soli]|uniref:YbaB/EbfC family DNA-binding protein n=1 Tax=Microbacterium soli TaxID=446075 RepID=A0ABP7N5T9_9MICO